MSIMMVGFQKGVFNNLVKISVEDFYGYVQVHKNGYTQDKSLLNTFEYSNDLEEYLLSNENVNDLHPRVETFSLSAFGEKTKGIPIMAVIPEQEFAKEGIKKRLIAGEFPTSESGGLVVTEKYAEYMGAKVGDSIAFIGQGYQGVSAVGLYEIKGIIKFPNPQLNSGFAFMELKEAQELFNLDNRLTSLVIRLDNNKTFAETTKELSSNLSEEYEILTWEQDHPEVAQLIESKANSGYIIMMILYIVVGFGIFGTALMMIAERTKEFAIMIAVGMRKTKILIIVAIEMIYITLLGIAASIVVSFPIMLALHLNPPTLSGEMAEQYANLGMDPIMPIAWDISYYLPQPIMILVITLFAIAYPLYTIRKLNLIKAMKK